MVTLFFCKKHAYSILKEINRYLYGISVAKYVLFRAYKQVVTRCQTCNVVMPHIIPNMSAKSPTGSPSGSRSHVNVNPSINDINLEALSLSEGIRDSPVCIIVLGMAGSGKTTFTRSLIEHAQAQFNPYVVNLDPACREVPYAAHIDIRDTVNYKEVMKQYQLGPNGGIVTALNMFTTKMPKFAELVRRAGERGHKWCIIDTPGQIEVFTWSASGNIITEGLATMFPTIVVYVMDVVRSVCPTTFMSNMLYACSILYKTRLPFLLALNKVSFPYHKQFVKNFLDFIGFYLSLFRLTSRNAALCRNG